MAGQPQLAELGEGGLVTEAAGRRHEHVERQVGGGLAVGGGDRLGGDATAAGVHGEQGDVTPDPGGHDDDPGVLTVGD